MPTYQTSGIVISRTNFGEADRIVRLITADHGKLSAVAKGVRRIKSRLGGHLELFSITNLTLATGRNLDVIATARLTWYPHQLTTDYNRLNLAYVMARLSDKVSAERQAQPELYAHLRDALLAVNTAEAGPLLELWFKLRLLTVSGYRPELQRCVVCGRQDETIHYAFSPSRGGIICEPDATSIDHPMPHTVIKLWRLLCDYPYATIAHITRGAELASASLDACDQFSQYQLGHS